MADPRPAIQSVKQAEGYFANFPGDAGGVTYAGITKNFNPEWAGWPIIMAYQAKLGRPLRTNEQVPGVEPYVDAFYLAKWNSYGLSQINNQFVAELIWDYLVNSATTATLRLETLLATQFGVKLKADRTFDAHTVAAINAQDPGKLYKALLADRKAFYNQIANVPHLYVVQPADTVASIQAKFRLPASEVPAVIKPGDKLQLKTNLQFLSGWLARLKKFEGLSIAQVATVSLGGLLTIGAAIFFLVRNNKKKKTAKQ